MSRAFVTERDVPDLRLERAAERPITPSGYANLRARADAESDPEGRAALERTLAGVAIVHPPADRRGVAFGARVRVRDGAGEREFTIVGEDEIDVERGRIGEASLLARALLGKRAGQKSAWKRPAGTRTIEILDVAYDDVSSSAA